MRGFKWRWAKGPKGILQLILLSCSNKYLIKSFNSEIRSEAKDNENWNVWERSPAKEKGSSHLLSPSYPSIILVPLSAHVSIRRERSHLSHAFQPKRGEVNNGLEAFIFHINIINGEGCQMSTVTRPAGSNHRLRSFSFIVLKSLIKLWYLLTFIISVMCINTKCCKTKIYMYCSSLFPWNDKCDDTAVERIPERPREKKKVIQKNKKGESG